MSQPPNPSSVLDIGANVGTFYYEAKARWPTAQFLLIEGNPACRPYLAVTGQRFVSAYLGDSRREVIFFKRKGGGTDTGNSYYRELTPYFADDQIEREIVQLVPLEELLPAEATFDFIKIDVQGAELDVIRGGMAIFGRAKWVHMEVAVEPYNEGAPLWDEVIAFMGDIGFAQWEIVSLTLHPITRRIVQRDVLFSRL